MEHTNTNTNEKNALKDVLEVIYDVSSYYTLDNYKLVQYLRDTFSISRDAIIIIGNLAYEYVEHNVSYIRYTHKNKRISYQACIDRVISILNDSDIDITLDEILENCCLLNKEDEE